MTSRRVRVFLILTAIIVASTIVGQSRTAPASASVRVSGKYSPASGAYVGTYSSTTGLNSLSQIESYYESREHLAGRTFDIQNFMPGWSNPLASGLVTWDISQGIIPLISWNTPTGMSDASITGGSQDSLIRAQADQLKALNTKIFLRFDWEMNGNWFPWDGTHNNDAGTTDGPAKYVAMWRHIHDIFVQQGATDVAWVWTPAATSLPDTAWNSFSAYYPGDAYVDWVGIDDYNYAGLDGHSLGWNDFSSQLQPFYGDYASRKPMMIGEMGSADNIAGHDKGQWINQMAHDVSANFPDIQALVWFDVSYDVDWRFDTSQSSLNAFRNWIATPYFNPLHRADPYTPAAPTPPPTAKPTAKPTAPPTAAPTATAMPAPPPANAPSGSLYVSTASNRSNPQSLSGATVGSAAYVFATYAQAPREVDFYVDDVRQSAAPFSVERSAPFDLHGTNGNSANPYNGSALGTGQHVLTAVATYASGARAATSAVFNVGDGPNSGLINVTESASANRSNAHAFSDSTVSGNAYITATISGVPQTVSFYVDDPARRRAAYNVESDWPYDLAGGSAAAANPLLTMKLGAGVHTLTVVAVVNGVGTVNRTMLFTVS